MWGRRIESKNMVRRAELMIWAFFFLFFPLYELWFNFFSSLHFPFLLARLGWEWFVTGFNLLANVSVVGIDLRRGLVCYSGFFIFHLLFCFGSYKLLSPRPQYLCHVNKVKSGL